MLTPIAARRPRQPALASPARERYDPIMNHERQRHRRSLLAGIAAGLCLIGMGALAPQTSRADDAELLAALKLPDHFGIMRHARAPGSDDPPNFRLGDCATQRNLSDGGRDQARAIGARLRASGISTARIVSSQWCRCLDTARLLGFGDAEELPYLNSLVSYPGQAARMTADLENWLGSAVLDRPTLLVTHQVNIDALVGAYPREGAIVVVQRREGGGLEVLGTLEALED
jgi:phosphohistidine phosphatase SixA